MNAPDQATFVAQMRGLVVQPTDPYIRVYPSLVRFFKDRDEINREDFVIGASIAYGWMPTILEIHGTDENWARAVAILNQAKRARVELLDELKFLKSLVNHSFIGVSKLLHFVNPEKHAIWDGRVFHYLTGKKPGDSTVNNLGRYVRYHAICDEITAWPEVDAEVARLRALLGPELTTLRAIELTMWANGAKR